LGAKGSPDDPIGRKLWRDLKTYSLAAIAVQPFVSQCTPHPFWKQFTPSFKNIDIDVP